MTPSSPAKAPRPSANQKPDPAAVLTKALLRASSLLGLSASTLARVLGVSEASISRLSSGARTLEPASKEGELALLLVRAYRSLDALVGTDAGQRIAWMTGFIHYRREWQSPGPEEFFENENVQYAIRAADAAKADLSPIELVTPRILLDKSRIEIRAEKELPK